MTHKGRTKFISEVTSGNDMTIAKPFKVEREDKRRFIRLEISSPMEMRKIKESGGGFWPHGERHTISGTILNISAGGVLVELEQSVREGDLVSMHFTMQDVASIDNVLGLAKRADVEGGTFVVGIEFISRSRLTDIMSRAEIDLLPENLTTFDERVREVLNQYIHQEKRVKA